MDPMTISLIASSVLGMLKGQQDQKAYKENQKIQAVKERWSPFTGRAGQIASRPNAMDPMMQALVTGAMIGGQFKGGASADPAAGALPAGDNDLPMASAQPNAAPKAPNVAGKGYLDPYNQ